MRPINDDEVLRALDLRTRGRGNGARTARELSIEPSHLREIKSGRRTVGLKVAAGLGYTLKWVKREEV